MSTSGREKAESNRTKKRKESGGSASLAERRGQETSELGREIGYDQQDGVSVSLKYEKQKDRRENEASSSKKPTCPHGKAKDRCKDCGGKKMCVHGRQKHTCKECGGSSICQHGRIRSCCKDCGGSSICTHGRMKNVCKECEGACPHGKLRSRCKDCGGGSFCPHGRWKGQCKDCGGTSICEHGRRKYRCKECKGSAICEHGKVKYNCRACADSLICDHGKEKSACETCSQDPDGGVAASTPKRLNAWDGVAATKKRRLMQMTCALCKAKGLAYSLIPCGHKVLCAACADFEKFFDASKRPFSECPECSRTLEKPFFLNAETLEAFRAAAAAAALGRPATFAAAAAMKLAGGGAAAAGQPAAAAAGQRAAPPAGQLAVPPVGQLAALTAGQLVVPPAGHLAAFAAGAANLASKHSYFDALLGAQRAQLGSYSHALLGPK